MFTVSHPRHASSKRATSFRSIAAVSYTHLIKQEITKILYEQGYILAYKFDTDEKGHPSIKIALKWDAATKTNAIKNLKRVSRPGLRQYASVADMPRVLNGLGIAILSTSKGIMTDAKARKENVGGEVLCYIYLLQIFKTYRDNVKNW